MNVELLEVLPIEKENCIRSAIYNQLYNSVKVEFTSNKELIPNSSGGFSAANDCMLLGSSDLADLLTKKQAKQLFGRNFWINRNITNDKSQKLREYIRIVLGIPEYDLTNFASKIDEEFMLQQSDNWLVQFYKTVHKLNSLWRSNQKPFGILRTKPIIRIENGDNIQQVLPFQNDGKPSVFLPTNDQTKYTTVKSNIAKNKEARKFLEDLGLTTPDLFAELNKFVLPKLRMGKMYSEYFDDFQKILLAVQSPSLEKRNHLIEDLKKCSFLLGINFETGETKLLKCNEVYIQSELLMKLYLGDDRIFFVAENQYNLTPLNQKHLSYLFKEFGVAERPIRKEVSVHTLSTEAKVQLRKTTHIVNQTWESINDYSMDGFEFMIKTITKEKSHSLWQILSSAPNDYFLGIYSWYNLSSYIQSRSFRVAFVNSLNKTLWLYDKSDNLVSPNQINLNQLPPSYQSGILSNFLKFKPDEITAIEERTGGKFISKEEYAAFEKFKKMQADIDIKTKPIEIVEEVTFKPAYKPSEATLNSTILDESHNNIEFKTSQTINIESDDYIFNNKLAGFETDTENGGEKPSQKLLNGIGDWGETLVHIDLSTEFENEKNIEIIDLNKTGQKGVGCDFIVNQNGEILRIIEVKTTVESFGHILSISGTQWEIARNFFKQKDGNKYWLYCVFNAGAENTQIIKIQNPIQKWKEGKLLAHPVNFVVR